MSEKIMMDGEPLKVGDEVYCLLWGEGVVGKIKLGELGLPVLVNFEGFVYCYTSDFKCNNSHHNRVLYRQKPEIIPPPKRKKKVKVWDWFVEGVNGDCKRINGAKNGAWTYSVYIKTAQKIDGTEREIEV